MNFFENLSTPTKQIIVVGAIIGIIALKVKGIIETKPTIALIVALGFVSVLTDANPTSSN